MLKLVAAGMWIILVTAGATFASSYLNASASESEGARPDAGMEELTSEMTSIPIMRSGDITGYLILQLSFAADRAVLAETPLDPLPFMKDAAFRVIISSSDIDFRHLKKSDLDRLTTDIASEANARIGVELVRSVLFQQFNFVRKEDIRTNWIGSGG